MNDAIKVMYEEHHVIMKAQKLINCLDSYWLENPEAFENTIRELVTFFKEYADGYHHRKEEEILFPALQKHPDFSLPQLIDEFMTHHDDFRDYAKGIIDNLEKKNYNESYKVLKQYMNDLLDHIAAENEELFVMAEQLLSDQEKDKLYFLFMDVDTDLGLKNKAELEQRLESLLSKFHTGV